MLGREKSTRVFDHVIRLKKKTIKDRVEAVTAGLPPRQYADADAVVIQDENEEAYHENIRQIEVLMDTNLNLKQRPEHMLDSC